MKIKFLFLGTVLCVFAAEAAFAQDPAYASFVERTNAATPPPPIDALTAPALETLQALARQENRCVPSGLRLEAPQTAIATAVITQAVAAGQAKNGWTVEGQPEGCADQAVTRFMVLRMADDSLRAFVVNEGRTLANPSLMRDTSAVAAVTAFQAVRTANPSCTGEDMRMGPTRIAERGTDLGPNYHGAFYSGSWSEVWTFTVCGRRAEVPVRFTADGQGGANYNVVSTEVRLVD